MLPMLKHELVENKGWVTEDELLDYYAIGQCTPGIIAVNTATFVGYNKAGVAGGIFSTLGMVSPSVILISIIASFLTAFMSNPIVGHAMMGIRGVVCALMLNTVITLARKSLINKVCVGICIAALLLALFTPIPTVLIVVIAGVFGLLYNQWEVRHHD